MKKFAWLVFGIVCVVCGLMFPGGALAFFGHGSGLPNDPYRITSCAQLQEMNTDLTASYVLMNDIDCSATVGWNGGAGFMPIGEYPGTPFAGTLDGRGLDGEVHAITNLCINRPELGNVGLFGYVGYGSIRNVQLINVNFSAQSAAGLVGVLFYGVVDHSYVTGEINTCHGGLVCWSNQSTISNSYSTVNVVNGPGYCGGLVGSQSGGSITNCYATGNVSGLYALGGLVGNDEGGLGVIRNCYSTGRVTTSDPVGWGSTVGGLVGMTSGNPDCIPNVFNSYWGIETSGQTTSRGGEGRTTAEMMQQATFVDWDFANIWAIREGVSYPHFVYVWSGFLSPIGVEPGTHMFKAGSSIPVKFRLGGDMGIDIFATGYPLSQRIVCGPTGKPIDGITIKTVSVDGLVYDPVLDLYTYVWKTDKSWKGCRQLVVMLSDGTKHYADFNFKK